MPNIIVSLSLALLDVYELQGAFVSLMGFSPNSEVIKHEFKIEQLEKKKKPKHFPLVER